MLILLFRYYFLLCICYTLFVHSFIIDFGISAKCSTSISVVVATAWYFRRSEITSFLFLVSSSEKTSSNKSKGLVSSYFSIILISLNFNQSIESLCSLLDPNFCTFFSSISFPSIYISKSSF